MSAPQWGQFSPSPHGGEGSSWLLDPDSRDGDVVGRAALAAEADQLVDRRLEVVFFHKGADLLGGHARLLDAVAAEEHDVAPLQVELVGDGLDMVPDPNRTSEAVLLRVLGDLVEADDPRPRLLGGPAVVLVDL